MVRHVSSVIGILALAAISVNAQAQRQPEPERLVGSWAVTVKGTGAHGDMQGTLVIKRTDAAFAGTLSAHGNEHALTGELVKGELKLVSEHSDASERLTLTAKLTGPDTLTGYLSGPMGDLSLTATRDKGDR